MLLYVESKDEFTQKLSQKGKVILIDFFATWCAPCNMLTPILEEIANSNNNVDILKVDVDKFPEIATSYSVSSIPALFVVKDNKVCNKHIGFCTKEHLESLLKV